MKILLLVFIFLIGILGITKERFFSHDKGGTFFNWQCPTTINKCPDGCIEQKTPRYNCGNRINYIGPHICARSCPYICSDPKKCGKNECCEHCGISDVSAKCGSLEGFVEGMTEVEAAAAKLVKQRNYQFQKGDVNKDMKLAHLSDMIAGKSQESTVPTSSPVGYSALTYSSGKKREIRPMRSSAKGLVHVSGKTFQAGDSLEGGAAEPTWNEYWPPKSGAPNPLDRGLLNPTYFDKSNKKTTDIKKIYTFNGKINGLVNYEIAEPTLKKEEEVFYAPYMKDDHICKRLMF